jgi:hypothetical protein
LTDKIIFTFVWFARPLEDRLDFGAEGNDDVLVTLPEGGHQRREDLEAMTRFLKKSPNFLNIYAEKIGEKLALILIHC